MSNVEPDPFIFTDCFTIVLTKLYKGEIIKVD
jgi:hypothetical protein